MSLIAELRSLKEQGKAALAFNLQNLYQIQAATQLAERIKAPIIIQFSERFLRFLHITYGVNYIIERFRNSFVYFHLDHCIDLEFIRFCVDSGFDSVMFDGSASPLEENIALTNEVRTYALAQECLVEGELGKVSGVEDGFGEEGSSYAEIGEIIKYVSETQIDMMALGIGNAHGFYNSLEDINMSILERASGELHKDQLFVLHGGTGLPEELVREAIGYGIVKINISTEIKKSTMSLIKEYGQSGDLFNEISFNNHLTAGLEKTFEHYIRKYTL